MQTPSAISIIIIQELVTMHEIGLAAWERLLAKLSPAHIADPSPD